MHDFLREYAQSSPNAAPYHKVVVFDEAQRAWNVAQAKHRRDQRFIGNRWQRVRQPEVQQYLMDKYRVLLTRAREGADARLKPR